MNPELYKKYNVAGPRYTSYPTVPYWDQSPTADQWISSLRGALDKAQTDNTGAAIYVHIPFCESLCTYCGCNTRITRNHGVSVPYTQTVLQEFDLYREKLGLTGQGKEKKLVLSELHLGGGTPTFFSPVELTHLLSGLFQHCEIHSDYEFSIEVDPRVTNREHLEVLKKFQFKRDRKSVV